MIIFFESFFNEFSWREGSLKRVDYVILEQSPLLPLHSEKKLAALDQGSAGKQRGRRVQARFLFLL